MNDGGADVKRLMTEVSGVIDDPSGAVEAFARGERRQVFNIDCAYAAQSESFRSDLDRLLQSWEIQIAYEPGSGGKPPGWLAAAVKKAVRALTGWYMNPLVHDVRRFNMLVARTLSDVSQSMDEIKDRLDSLEKSEAELRRRIARK